jgi:hypothetical protein
MRFLPLQRFPAKSSGANSPDLPHLSTSASKFSQLPDASTAPRQLVLFHTRSALGVSPSEPCSSHAAARRLQRLYPRDIRKRLTEASSTEPQPKPRFCISRRPVKRPLPSGPYSARESAASDDGLDRPRHVALLGFIPSKVLSLAGMARPSPRLPS